MDTQALVLRRGLEVVIVYRGTEPSSLTDLRADCRAWFTRQMYGAGKSHAGTVRALDAVWPQVLGLAKSTPKTQVHVIGHSLGGMLAQETVLRLFRHGVEVKSLTTFGSPPAGDKVFIGCLEYLLDGRWTYVVNCADRVPRLKTMWLLGYSWPHHTLYIDRHGNCRANPSAVSKLVDRTLRRSSNFLAWIRGEVSLSFSGIRDHYMETYRRLLTE